MKRVMIVLLAVMLLSINLSIAEDVDYGFFLSDESSIRVSPTIDYTLLSNDPDELLVMETIRDWYISDTSRGHYFEAQELVLFVAPFIFDIHEAEGTKNIYCVCTIDEYGLVENKNNELHFYSGYTTYLPFDLLYTRQADRWEIANIRIPSKDEELITGWGTGTQGMNGISDEMMNMMTEAQYDNRIAQLVCQYMEAAGIEDVQIVDLD